MLRTPQTLQAYSTYARSLWRADDMRFLTLSRWAADPVVPTDMAHPYGPRGDQVPVQVEPFYMRERPARSQQRLR